MLSTVVAPWDTNTCLPTSSNGSRPAARVQIAPMLAVTDRHFRRFFRGITRKAELWTEMHVGSTLLHTSNLDHCLKFHDIEHPVVCQLGGSDPAEMADAAALVERYGYDEVNINVGCPSAKVAGRGCFGAALMKSAESVREIVSQIKRRVGANFAVSVKTRCGVDEDDSMEFLRNFISIVSSSGCKRFIIHARKAWLNGINPTRNRRIPPLEYHKVYQLANEFPDLSFSLNGGVANMNEVAEFLSCRWRPLLNNIPEQSTISSKDENHENHVRNQELPTAELPTTETDGCHNVCQSTEESLDHSESSPTDDSSRYWHDDDVGYLMALPDVGTVPSRKRAPKLRRPKRRDERMAENAILRKGLPRTDSGLLTEVTKYLDHCSEANFVPIEGVMLGRTAMNNPCLFSTVDSRFYNVPDPETASTPLTIVKTYMDYLEEIEPSPVSQKSIFLLVKPILGLLNGRPGGKQFRFKLDECIRLRNKDLSPSAIIQDVLDYIEEKFPETLHMR